MSQAGYTGVSVAGGPYSDRPLAGETDGTETQAAGGEVGRFLLSASIKVSPNSPSPYLCFSSLHLPPLKCLEMKNTSG